MHFIKRYFNYLLPTIAGLLLFLPCLSQLPSRDILSLPVSKIKIAVNASRFTSQQVTAATSDYKNSLKTVALPTEAIGALRKKNYSFPVIMAAVRMHNEGNIKILNFVSNTEIAEDAQLMLKSIPGLTAADIINTLKSLYDLTPKDIFNIAVLTRNDSVQRVYEPRKSFTYHCECKLTDPATASASRPLRAMKTKYIISTYFHNLYPWGCYEFWNAGLRSTILVEKGINEFLRIMKSSSYPLYEGLVAADLDKADLDFRVILGTAADSLSRLMECTALPHRPLGFSCVTDIPFGESGTSYREGGYFGSCYFSPTAKAMCHLDDLLPVLKRNGYSMAIIATAVKQKFPIPDDDMRQRILACFQSPVFSTTEIAEVARVLNEN